MPPQVIQERGLVLARDVLRDLDAHDLWLCARVIFMSRVVCLAVESHQGFPHRDPQQGMIRDALRV